MKKRFALIFLCVLSVCFFALSACNDVNYTKNDIEMLYKQIVSQYGNNQNLLDVSIDTSDFTQSGTGDRSYIFELCYEPYIASSSGLFFGVAKRQGDTSGGTTIFATQNFNQEEINTIYNKLVNVKNNFDVFYDAKTVYEGSQGNLYYKETIEALNNLISSLYDLNDNFATYYFNYYYTDFSTQNTLLDGSLKDFMWYELCAMSKVSFTYELKDLTLSNPNGEVLTWYNNTKTVKDFVQRSSKILDNLNKNNLVDSLFDEQKQTILTVLKNIQVEIPGYESEYSLFEQMVSIVDLKEYFDATNQDSYIQSCPANQQSAYNIINNFLEGRYMGFIEGIEKIMQNLV